AVSIENEVFNPQKFGAKLLDVSPFSKTNGMEIQKIGGINCVGVAIVHGAANGWQTESRNKFFFYDCFSSFSVVKKDSHIERGTGSQGPTPKLLGDAISLDLENGATALTYWDGSTYRGLGVRKGD